MARITAEAPREIVEDFAKEIQRRKTDTAKPSQEVINFRDDQVRGTERPVWRVPIDLLRYRKDNGRIASDVLDYEQTVAPLDENDEGDQAKIREFLEGKDPERTEVLVKSILHAGQQQPVIITCDGFLINGNRRKMAMERLLKESPSDENLRYMQAVILPGRDEEGGPPTLVEIEKIENRYQLQSDGRAEYYSFDRALSIKRKVDLGFTLEEQVADDPTYAGTTNAQLKRVVDRYQKDYLDPLACIDRYLRQFARDGLYRTVSRGIADSEGRWQAFADYSATFTRYFSNPKRRMEIGIKEEEIGELEAAAFDIIRLRTVPDMPKVHKIMRDYSKLCRTEEGKQAIKRIVAEVAPVLPPEECVDEEGEELSIEEIDAKWEAKYRRPIIYNLKKASQSHQHLKEKETPIELLEEAHRKLTHDNMDLSAIDNRDLRRAREIIGRIIRAGKTLESDIFQYTKNMKRLSNKR